jgi:hypothetical protein
VVQVFLTVDSEVWPATPAAFGTPGAPLDLEPAIAAYFDGHTQSGDFGVPFQLELLREHGLRATFFVEPLFSLLAGRPALARMVGLIQSAGQDVQVHAHTEWLSLVTEPGLPREGHSVVRRYPEAEQAAIIGRAAALLREAGASPLRAFRAGGYGADLATLRALAACGLPMDTSLNVPYLGGPCDIRADGPAFQPFDLGGTLEVPITYFQDWPGHHRPLQLGACSSWEIEAVLWGAARAGWRTAVLVFHSVELLKRVPDMALTGVTRPERVVVRRFERLCRFLGRHREVFETATFGAVDETRLRGAQPRAGLSSHVGRTAWRYAEQIASRLG